MKTKKLLFMAIISGLITTILFYMFLNKGREETAGPAIPMVKVVKAVQDIKKNEKITEENITTAEIPEDQLHSQAVQDPNTIIGKYTSADLKQGEVVMQHRIEQIAEEAKVVSKKIREGYRAVSIDTNYVESVSTLIEPEDFVDVVLTVQAPESVHLKTELILEKVKVLSVGTRMVETGKDSEVTEEGGAPEYMAVTLELNQEDSVKLINASERGNLQLILYSRLSSKEAEQRNASVENGSKIIMGEAQFLPVSKRSIIRKEPNLNAHVIAVVGEGTTLSYLGDERTDEEGRLWLRIETPDEKQGWISSRIVKQKGE